MILNKKLIQNDSDLSLIFAYKDSQQLDNFYFGDS